MRYFLDVLPGRLAICRLGPDDPVPMWARGENLWSVTRTVEELSLVCEEESVPETATAERGWRALKVRGPLAFSMVGVLAELARVLAKAQVSIFVLSTFDTDYLLVKEVQLAGAIEALQQDGNQVLGG